MKLNDTTLVIIDCVDVNRAIDALNICKYYTEFEDIKFLSSIENDNEHFIKIDPLNSIREYSKFVLKDLNDFVNTNFVLIAQWDGFILNPNAWINEFFEYDYIGAPWVMRGRVVGNGGFSLRSKKLLETVSNLMKKQNFKITMPEDFIISGYLKETLIKNFNIKFPSIELADKFSVEDIGFWNGEFGFHNYNKVDIFRDGWNPPNINYLTNRFLKQNNNI